MTQENQLDISGNFRKNPLAETFAEIRQARLDGSLRVSRENLKTIVYFDSGNVVFAVSNSRSFRLFSILLNNKTIDKETLAKCPNFADDRALAAELQKLGIFSKEQIADITNQQIESIIIDALSWPDGEWTFSPLARIREDMKHKPRITHCLLQYARCLGAADVAARFKSMQELFEPSTFGTVGELQSHEAFVLSKFDADPMTIDQILTACRLPENTTLQSLYGLWMSGGLSRSNWNSAFSASKIDAIKGAKVSMVRSAAVNEAHNSVPNVVAEAEKPSEPNIEISVEQYLDRIENAQTHYDIFDLDIKTGGDELKRAYFQLAKLFHPDHYHRSDPKLLARVQKAFSNLAHAYETLKSPELREIYDFKIRKELDAVEKRRAAGLSDLPDSAEKKDVMGDESFRAGFDLLSDDEYVAAIPHLARAVHFNPENAQYRAYYGRALTIDPKSKHKAESEMQAAIRLAPENMDYRIMLIEFFLEMNLMKRAEGELNRLLAVQPNHKEAAGLLRQIQDTVR